MSRSSIKYIDASYLYGASVKAKPVTKPAVSPVIYGRFPKHPQALSATEKINRVLSSVLLCFVVLALVSYYFVSDCERTMNKLGREIVALNNENIELQNKLDNLNSFNRVDSIIQGDTRLDTAKKVIEIPAVNNTVVPSDIMTVPVNYKWNIGY